MKFVIGIDPGLGGAIAYYDTNSKTLHSVQDFPLLTPPLLRKGKNPFKRATTKRQLDMFGLATLIDAHAKDTLLACVEDVSAMTYVDRSGQTRGQGAVASFSFGKVHGQVLGILAACMIPIVLVRPAIWKSLMVLSSDKGLSREKATALFPRFRYEFCRHRDDGRAEAALLAYFGAQRLVT